MHGEPEVVELDPQKLETLLQQIQAALGEEVAQPFRQLLASYARLMEIVANREMTLHKLRQLLFGASTESARNVLGEGVRSPGGSAAGGLDSATGEGGVLLTDGATAASGESNDRGDRQDNGSQRRRPPRGHGRNGADRYTGLETIFVPHAYLEPSCPCPECSRGKVYVEATPKKLVRLRGQAPIGGKVYHLERLRCNLCGQVFVAEAPEEAGSEKYDATAISMIALLRYGYGMAWNRLALLQWGMGIPLPASTQWDLANHAASELEFALEYLIGLAAQGGLMHNDDTSMRVLELMDPEKRIHALNEDDPDRRGIFTTCILSIADGHSISLFFTGTRHAGENLRELLARRQEELEPPIQMCDPLSRNMPEDLRVIVANCLSHARRQFVDVVNAFRDEVAYVVEAFKEIYTVDAEAKASSLSAEERLRLHQEKSGPVMERLQRWLKEQLEEKKVEPNSGLGKAIVYMLRRWDKLTLFLRKAGAPLDNNVCERALKKAILHRKNSLFYKTRRGAHVGDLFMSLIYTCILSRVDPLDYLSQLLRNQQRARANPQEWMPWNYAATLARASPSEPIQGDSSAPSLDADRRRRRRQSA